MKWNYKNATLLALRLIIVFIFLWHGLPKATDWAMATEKFAGMGFPGFLGPVVGIVEVVAAVLILIGLWQAWANYALAVIIIAAIIGVQLPKGVTAGLERDLLILAGAFVLASHGPGLCAIQKK